MKLDFKFKFSELTKANLNIDAIYQGGSKGNVSDDPISKLLGLENAGGFRSLGTRTEPNLLALISSTEEPEWPDSLDIETGIFTYYGDNRTPGHTILDTAKKGNQCLENLFSWIHSDVENRKKIAPIFVFTKEGLKGRDYRFRGLAVPGNPLFSQKEDLVAVWQSKNNVRFQNYKATFSILSVDIIKREWIVDIHNKNVFSDNCPKVWKEWIETGKYKILESLKEKKTRTKEDQMPQDTLGKKLLDKVYKYFSEVKDEYDFEKFAGKIFEMSEPGHVLKTDVTKNSRDGGRDVVGNYKIGTNNTSYQFSYALEAKRWKPDGAGLGVSVTKRLISRIKYREFGVFVTTSYVSKQAYEEIVEDNHPIIFISGRDIVDILLKSGIENEDELEKFLHKNFN